MFSKPFPTPWQKRTGFGAVALVLSIAATAQARTAGNTAISSPSSSAQSPSVQSSSAQSSGDQPTTTVTVTAARPKVLNKVDRKVYRADGDLSSATGDATDVLNNIPSVEVDPDGNVSLRGDSDVTVLIDGKPVAQMQGGAKASALQGLSASDIEQIEVVTSPSAEFKPDGSAGIINIVTRKNRKRGVSGTVQANQGDGGRYNAGLSAGYIGRRFAVHGGLSVRNDIRKRTVDSETTSSLATGNGATTSHQAQTESNNRKSANAGVDLTPNDKQTFSLSGDYASRDEQRTLLEHSVSTGAAPSVFDRPSSGGGPRTDDDLGFKFDQKTDRQGEDFTVGLKTSQSVEKNRFDYTTLYASPATATSYEQDFTRQAYGISELSADYVRPFTSGSVLKLGYDGEYDQDRFDDTTAKSSASPASLVQDHAFDNTFRYRQTIDAIYASYDEKLGKLELLTGLRLEQVKVFTLQKVSGDTGTQAYATLYPTLNAVYTLSDENSLTAGFSRRVRRRDPEDLNPYINASDPNNLRQGNPALKPELTNTFQVGYRHAANAGPSYEVTGYYRTSHDGDTELLTVISSDVVLIREANLPSSRSGGVEFISSGKILPKLSYSASGNLFYSEINALALGAGTRSTIGFSGKASLDFQASANDRWQVSAQYSGKRLTAQGYVLPVGTTNIGYRHQVDAKLAIVATLSDIFNSQRQKRLFITPTYTETYERHQFGRLAYIGLAYTFGVAKKARDSDFTYDQ